MAQRLDAIVVLDLEATCWAGPPPAGQQADIIEIGLALLPRGDAVAAPARALLLRPERSQVSAFCTELTTLTQEQVAGGVSLAAACRTLRQDYRSRERAWASWGDYDRRMLQRCCRDLAVTYPFGPTHLNVKHLFALALGLEQEVELAEALGLLGLSFEGTLHRGGDDAWNVARVLGELLARARRGAAAP